MDLLCFVPTIIDAAKMPYTEKERRNIDKFVLNNYKSKGKLLL